MKFVCNKCREIANEDEIVIEFDNSEQTIIGGGINLLRVRAFHENCFKILKDERKEMDKKKRGRS